MITRSTFLYAAISCVCMLMHNVVMIAGSAIGWGLALSVIVSFCLVSTTGYFLHSLLTFHQRLSASRFARYVFAVSANIPLVFITVWFWKGVVGLDMLWASPIATVCMVGVNYLLSRWAIISGDNEVIR